MLNFKINNAKGNEFPIVFIYILKLFHYLRNERERASERNKKFDY